MLNICERLLVSLASAFSSVLFRQAFPHPQSAPPLTSDKSFYTATMDDPARVAGSVPTTLSLTDPSVYYGDLESEFSVQHEVNSKSTVITDTMLDLLSSMGSFKSEVNLGLQAAVETLSEEAVKTHYGIDNIRAEQIGGAQARFNECLEILQADNNALAHKLGKKHREVKSLKDELETLKSQAALVKAELKKKDSKLQATKDLVREVSLFEKLILVQNPFLS